MPSTTQDLISRLTTPLDLGALPIHGAEKHKDVTRELFIPALDDSDANATFTDFGYHTVIQVADAVLTKVRWTLKVPDDFVSFGSVKLVWTTPSGATNMRWNLVAQYAANGEIANLHQDVPALGETAAPTGDFIKVEEPANPLTLSSLAIGDYLGIEFTRDGAHENDTINDVVYILGLLFTYTAEQ